MDKLFLTFTTQQKLNYKPRHRVRELQKIMRSTKIGCEQRKVTSGTTITTDYVEGRAYRKQPVAVFSEGASWRWGIYVSNHLQLFNPPEGYVEPINASNYASLFRHTFQYKDHQGNIRLSYKDLNQNTGAISLSIVEENNYYSFGLEHKGYNNVVNGTENSYKQYQGQEWTEDLGLNIHEWKYRISYPDIGRFWQVDPLAEDYTYNSTYAFQENKLGMGTELEGAEMYPFPWLGQDAVKNPNGVGAHIFGVAQGLENAATDFVNAVSNPVPTLKGAGNAAIWALAGSQFSPAIDNALGSNATATGDALMNSVVEGGDALINGNGQERGQVLGRFLGAAIGTKGTTLGLKGLSTVSKTANITSKLTTSEGFLLGGIKAKAPFDISVQRFGLMKVDGLNHFSPQIGSGKFANRTFNAIKPEFNSLDLFTKGTIPKGTQIKFGIVGPQGLKYPGGNIQILANPRNVIDQTSKLINQ